MASIITDESARIFARKNVPAIYAKTWTPIFKAWLLSFLDDQTEVGSFITKLASFTHPFNTTRLNRFWALSNTLSDSDLELISDMVRTLKWDVGLGALQALAVRVTGLPCTVFLSSGVGGDITRGIITRYLDVNGTLDNGITLDAVKFPFFLVFSFSLSASTIGSFSTFKDASRYLEVYKPVRYDMVFEASVDVTTLGIIPGSVVDEGALDSALTLDVGVNTDFTYADVVSSLQVFIDGQEVDYDVDGVTASWVSKGGQKMDVYVLGNLILEYTPPVFPVFSVVGGWLFVLDFKKLYSINSGGSRGKS